MSHRLVSNKFHCRSKQTDDAPVFPFLRNFPYTREFEQNKILPKTSSNADNEKVTKLRKIFLAELRRELKT